MHETQTAALEAADNSVILHFLKALWSYGIMQSRLRNKDEQPSEVAQIYFFPRKKKKKHGCSSCRLAYATRKLSNGSEEEAENHHFYRCQPQHYSPPTTLQHVSNVLGRSSYMQSHTYLRKGNTKTSASIARCCQASVSFVSVLSDFLASHFYELISCSQRHKRQRLKAQPEAGRRTKSNRSVKKKWPLCT